MRGLADLALERYPHAPFLERTWNLRDLVTAYDAVYLALAEALGAPLLTCDARLARTVASDRGLSIAVELHPSSGLPS